MWFIPDYSLLTKPGTIPLNKAITAGRKEVALPALCMMIGLSVIGVVLPILGYSFWFFPVFFLIGILLSFSYTAWITPKWRIWAYSGVQEIHQFQRAAELSRLLPRQSAERMVGFMNSQERAMLVKLQHRFKEDMPFMDDPEIGELAHIYERSIVPSFGNRVPLITINVKGINTRYGFYSWAQIDNERIATKSLVRLSARTGAVVPSGTREVLFFVSPEGLVEIPLADLDINEAKLDYLLHVYRGRYMQTDKPPDEKYDSSL